MEIKTSGYWKVIKNGIQISRHSDDKKAIASAAKNGGGIIIPPDKITVTISPLKPDSVDAIKIEDK